MPSDTSPENTLVAKRFQEKVTERHWIKKLAESHVLFDVY